MTRMLELRVFLIEITIIISKSRNGCVLEKNLILKIEMLANAEE